MNSAERGINAQAYLNRTGAELGRLQYRLAASRFFGALDAAAVFEPDMKKYSTPAFWDEVMHRGGTLPEGDNRGIKAIELALNVWE